VVPVGPVSFPSCTSLLRQGTRPVGSSLVMWFCVLYYRREGPSVAEWGVGSWGNRIFDHFDTAAHATDVTKAKRHRFPSTAFLISISSHRLVPLPPLCRRRAHRRLPHHSHTFAALKSTMPLRQSERTPLSPRVADQVTVGTAAILESPHVTEGPGRIANAPVPSVYVSLVSDRAQ
jgi:hypothetical protein